MCVCVRYKLGLQIHKVGEEEEARGNPLLHSAHPYFNSNWHFNFADTINVLKSKEILKDSREGSGWELGWGSCRRVLQFQFLHLSHNKKRFRTPHLQAPRAKGSTRKCRVNIEKQRTWRGRKPSVLRLFTPHTAGLISVVWVGESTTTTASTLSSHQQNFRSAIFVLYHRN